MTIACFLAVLAVGWGWHGQRVGAQPGEVEGQPGQPVVQPGPPVVQPAAPPTVVPVLPPPGARQGMGPAVGGNIFQPYPDLLPMKLDQRFAVTLQAAPSTQPAADCPERVITRRGDAFAGRALGLGKDGILRFTSQAFDGEVRVKASELVTLELSPGRPSTAPDTVVITNGDRLAGRVTDITADAVVLDSDAAGPGVKITRKVVQMITFGQSASSLSESNFASGKMEPWKAANGVWKVEGGCLVCPNRGTINFVKARLKQDKPVAIEITVEPNDNRGGGGISILLALFVDDPDNNAGSNSVFCRLEGNELYMGNCQNGAENNQIDQGINVVARGGATVLRFAYDPGTGKSKCWINGDNPVECDMSNNGVAPKTGNWVTVGTLRGCKIRSIRLTGGEFAPGESPDAKVEADTVTFTNKDHVAAKSLTLADGQLHVETAFGELACPVGKLACIAFSSDSRATPKSLKNQRLVQTPAGNVTVQLDSLDGQSLVGKCDYLGVVTIRRGAIKAIVFDGSGPISGAGPVMDSGPAEGMRYREQREGQVRQRFAEE
jgi:hypothetical protein